MDIWKWVLDTQKELTHQGHQRLVHLMRMLPHYTVNEDHVQVDALVPEALALARSIKNTWLEVFIRHWYLQSRVAHRHDVMNMLPEAVSLLEFAHRDETRDCPQSICAVQDLTNCYEQADGPAYVEERLAVANETLAKIDATWPCFICISVEYATALVDGKRYEEALAFLKQQAHALLLANQGEDRLNMRDSWIEALIRLQRYEEAYDIHKQTSELGRSKSSRTKKAIDKARITAYLGRYEEAKSALPDFATIAPTPRHYFYWAETAKLLAEAAVIPNDCYLNAKFQQMIDKFSHNGVVRAAFTMILWQAELALKRGHPKTATRCCERAEALIPRLRKPLDAPQLLEELRAKVATALTNLPTITTAWTHPDHVLEALGDEPETNLDILEAARKRWPEHESIAMFTATAYDEMGEHQRGIELLRQYLESYPNSPEAMLKYGLLLFNDEQHDALQDFVSAMLKRELDKEVHLNCHRLLTIQYDKDGEFELAKPHLLSLLEQEPNDTESRTLLAELERKTGHLENALHHLDWLVEQHEETGNYDWERMIVATLLKDWDRVRHSADRLGFENIPREGPIEQNLGRCRIQFREANGESMIHYAIRTGPVTAQILEIASPSNTQHYGDTVVFEPVSLNEADEEAAQDDEDAIYASIQITEAGGYTSCYILDGVHPGEEALQQLKTALAIVGCSCQVQSGDRYQLQLDDNSEPMLGLYAYIAVPETQPLQKVADLLATITQDYAHPLIWPGIVEKLGDNDEVERQLRIEEEYGL
jgi:tetratricopeptide (TPR) repeat protein